jgi:hypothetical protein
MLRIESQRRGNANKNGIALAFSRAWNWKSFLKNERKMKRSKV